jgi:hypothetical protein
MTGTLLTLPQLAVALGLSLDYVRRRVRSDPSLARYIRRAGPSRCVESSDLDAVRTLLTNPTTIRAAAAGSTTRSPS